MPTLKFSDLGITPGTDTVSVTGNAYLLMTDDPSTAILFDLREYVIHPPDERCRVRFKRTGHLEIPIFQPSWLTSLISEKVPESRIPREIGTATRIYVVNLTGQEPAEIGWQHLYRLFPEAAISNIPLGRTDWKPVMEEEGEQRTIQQIEATGFVERGEKVEVGKFVLFLFRSKNAEGLANVLVTGETNGRAFSFFFGESAFADFFPINKIEANDHRVHHLSAGKWCTFYAHQSHLSESTPAKELAIEHT